MKSGMGKKAGTRIFAGALAGVIIVFALVSAFYIHNFDQTLLEENQSHLAEVADHIVTYIRGGGGYAGYPGDGGGCPAPYGTGGVCRLSEANGGQAWFHLRGICG